MGISPIRNLLGFSDYRHRSVDFSTSQATTALPALAQKNTVSISYSNIGSLLVMLIVVPAAV
ncbi:MAG TPA: hypothetical protein VEU53_00125 [Stellaceae bacterium]|nr:hypothetical protein [Stellaceae bacterium]